MGLTWGAEGGVRRREWREKMGELEIFSIFSSGLIT